MRELKQCKDLYGPLSESNRRLLLNMLYSPGATTWRLAKRIVITAAPIITLDMAVKMVAPGWVKSTPDAFTIRRAILYALRAQREFHVRETSWRNDG